MPKQNEQENECLITRTDDCEAAPSPGYGKCSASGCYCPAYEGSADTCSNCGHNYNAHW
jgi:hypothetical protein